MRYFLISIMSLYFAFAAIAQNNYMCEFRSDIDFDKMEDLELEDNQNTVIITLSNKSLKFKNAEYLLQKIQKKSALINKYNNNTYGFVNRNFKSFSYSNVDYKLSKKKRKPYNFVIIDTSNGHIHSKIKIIKQEKKEKIIIEECDNINLLPFIFMISLSEIQNNKAIDIIHNLSFLQTE